MYGNIAPKLADLTDKVLYADVWERPGLSKRDRSLATVSALIAMNRPDQLRSHLRIARENGGDGGRTGRDHHAFSFLLGVAERSNSDCGC